MNERKGWTTFNSDQFGGQKKTTINGINIQEKSVVNFADFFATLNWNMAFNYKQYKNRLRD